MPVDGLSLLQAGITSLQCLVYVAVHVCRQDRKIGFFVTHCLLHFRILELIQKAELKWMAAHFRPLVYD